ncbi:MAG TPA: hypothetical protein VHK90_18640, partial [Thermoanaerobaculia bacterium]|nr:hypothetical protein [Thermoanaerobaculia bacterium]
MRLSFVLLLLLAAVPHFAQHAQVSFDPPVPTTLTPVTMKVRAPWPTLEQPRDPQAVRAGNVITITWTLPAGGRTVPSLWQTEVWLGLLPAGTYDVRLRFEGVPETYSELLLVVRDADPTFIVRPAIVSTAGTAPAFIVASTSPNPLCTQAASFAVTVDGVTAPVLQRIGCNLAVQLPPNEPGPATVRVTVNGVAHEVIAALHYVDPASAPDPALYERMLIPVLMEGAGAFGSQWTTEAVMINADPDVIEGVHDVAKAMPVLTIGQQSPSLLTLFGNQPSGLLLFVPHGHDVRFGNLIRDLS